MAMYVVRNGDTLSSIAQRAGVSLSALVRANPSLSDPNKLRIGQQLRLPDRAPTGTAPAEGGWPQRGVPPLTGGTRLVVSDYVRGVNGLGCTEATLRAVVEVENELAGPGFLPSGKPKLRFDASVFARYTHHRFNRTHPNISSSRPDPAAQTRSGEHQYERLAIAQSLDPIAALKAGHWGLFQIPGYQHAAAGFPSVSALVEAMFVSEGRHLDALVAWLKNNGLHRVLQSGTWEDFARGFKDGNPPANYEARLAQAYQKYTA
jgi:LysM repeat protein